MNQQFIKEHDLLEDCLCLARESSLISPILRRLQRGLDGPG